MHSRFSAALTPLLATVILCATNLAWGRSVADFDIISRGSIKAAHPAFLALDPNHANGARLLISSFGVFGGDNVSAIDNMHRVFQHGLLQSPVTLTRDVTWPNEVVTVGPELLGSRGYLICSGFLIPGKSHGAITFVDAASGAQRAITAAKKGWFYHRVEPVRWGPDGSLALLTARATKPMFGAASGELVLLLPQRNGNTVSFSEEVLTIGPDVYFRTVDLNGDGVEEIIAAEFFSQRLELLWWEGALLKRRLIDDKTGPAFDVAIADLAGDGSRAVVLTNHEGGHKGAVYAYEIPRHFKTDTWQRHTLLGRIHTRRSDIGAASPGAPLIFQPTPHDHGKPWIFVSGDGSQKGHLLTPASEDPHDWQYNETIVVDTTSTIGKAVIGDVDNDGYPDLLIPGYDANTIWMFSIKPKQR